MKICSIEDCNNKHEAKGLCNKHYLQQHYQDNKKSYAEWGKRYYQNNKEHFAEWSKQYRQDNKEHLAERHKQYYQENREHIIKHRRDNKEHFAKYNKEYYQTPAGRASIKACKHNRRILTKGLTKATIQQVYEDNIKKYGQLTCCLCFKPIEFGEDSLDHATPLTREGTNNYDNLGVAHYICNIRKHTMTLEEWFNSTVKGV